MDLTGRHPAHAICKREARGAGCRLFCPCIEKLNSGSYGNKAEKDKVDYEGRNQAHDSAASKRNKESNVDMIHEMTFIAWGTFGFHLGRQAQRDEKMAEIWWVLF